MTASSIAGTASTEVVWKLYTQRIIPHLPEQEQDLSGNRTQF